MTQDIEKFGIKFQDDNVKFAYKQALQQYGKKLQQEIKTIYKFNNRPITQEDLNRAKRAIASRGISSLPPMRSTGTVMQKAHWFDVVKRKKHPALKRAGVSGFGKPKRTPKHPKKSHVVVVKDGDKVKTIRFGEQGASVAGKPKKGESKRMKAKRKSFKSRHRKNINRGKTSAAYWANKVKW